MIPDIIHENNNNKAEGQNKENTNNPLSSQNVSNIQPLSFEQLRERDKKTLDSICNDGKFAYYFFHEKCRPLLNKIIWKVYNSEAEYDELVNDLFLYLKEPKDGEYWYKLKTFDYRTSLFDWIKTVATRRFYSPNSETFDIPEHIIESGVAEDMFLHVKVAIQRKYLWFRYLNKLDGEELAAKLEIDKRKLSSLSRCSIKTLKKEVQQNYPEYYNELFHEKKMVDVDLEKADREIVHDGNGESKIDALAYLNQMPNKRYKLVISYLFLEEKTPEEVSSILNTPIPNVYNIKLRAIEQLRDIVMYTKGIGNYEYYIKKIPDDRFKDILLSMFIKKEDYDTISAKYSLSKDEFRSLKKKALKELKSLIFNK